MPKFQYTYHSYTTNSQLILTSYSIEGALADLRSIHAEYTDTHTGFCTVKLLSFKALS